MLPDRFRRLWRAFGVVAHSTPHVMVVKVWRGLSHVLGQRHAPVANEDHSIPSRVVVLSQPGGPSAVRRIVGLGWIDSVEREAFRAWAHVGYECGEVIAPAVADGDTSPAVVGEVTGGLDVAPALHCPPDGVFPAMRACHVAVLSVPVPAGAHRFLLAAARARVAVQQVLAHLHGGLAAVAAAHPGGASSFLAWCTFDNGQQSEPLAGQVFRRAECHICRYDWAALTVSSFAVCL